MRDPAATIEFEPNWVVRRAHEGHQNHQFLKTELAQRLVSDGNLISFEWIDETTIRAPRLPFVTFPEEWTASQLHSAAKLTLQIQSQANAAGWDLKDASAWNIVFDGLRPVFVDLLSFQPLSTKMWQAGDQFSRQFILPLLLEKKGLIKITEIFKIWRDGIPPNVAAKIIGPMRYFSRYSPLMMRASRRKSNSYGFAETYNEFMGPNDYFDKKASHDTFSQRRRINTALNWMVDGVDPQYEKRSTQWSNYEDCRNHYKSGHVQFKKSVVSEWIKEINPNWVLDVGCNAGEFSNIAVMHGAKVICWDSDQGALNKLFGRYENNSQSGQYHIISADIDDISGGRGWMGSEFPGLFERLYQKADLVLLLAISHHLYVSSSIPLSQIFSFFYNVTRKNIILELISHNDVRVRELCHRFNRNPSEFTIQKQIDAATKSGFIVKDRKKFREIDERELIWLSK